MEAKYLVIKSKNTDMFSAGTNLSTIHINAYKENWAGLNPLFDDLIKDPIIEKEGNKIKITGKKVEFSVDLSDYTYGKKYLILDEVNPKTNKKLTVDDVLYFIKYKSAGKLILKPEDVKLCYDGFKDWLFRRKTYYIDTTKDVISKLEFIEPFAIKEVNGKFTRNRSSQMTIETDFCLETTNYTINYN